ncbi:MAG: phosphatidylinositol-3-phosphatase [Solirubrobacterales bacterium]|nr:phosphatidylinositol-3-phosphatase [Solirubrobacterales bacterium]
MSLHRVHGGAALIFVGVIAVALLACGAKPTPAAPKPPPIKHVFTIMLENKGYDETFGDPPGSTYLAQTLPAKGQLLTQYYGTGHFSLGNYITMISGQSENPTTQSDCGAGFVDVTPGTIAADGQAVGSGCVYPANVSTVADQLEKADLTWRAYMEDMGDDPARDGGTNCAHPAIGANDVSHTASPTDQYATRHNPFVYFHSIIDDYASCSKHDVNLDQLKTDLKKQQKTRNYTFITPDLCRDGHDATCADPNQPGGYAGIDGFLREWVPRILKSKAYKKDGLLIVTFDEAEYDGTPEAAASCCFAPTGPNAAQQGIAGPGGGRTGAVLLSPFIDKGTVNDTPYNHYDYLHTIEQIFGLKYLGYAAHAGVRSFGRDVFSGG